MNNSPKILIVIPARYASTRLPGKPLMMIAGKTMLQHVCETAQQAAQQLANVDLLVATDDDRILQHAQKLGVNAVMTPSECATGTDRIIAALSKLSYKPQAVINLQGDAPLTPLSVISALLHALNAATTPCVVTPAIQLSWQELDSLRQTKQTAPFSGTTVIIDANNRALWFSKQIIPAIRNELKLRSANDQSPIYQHLGLYGYTTDMLEVFANLSPSNYEQLEGLEQLRLLENGHPINVVKLTLPNLNAWRGVDTLEDAKFVEQLLTASN